MEKNSFCFYLFFLIFAIPLEKFFFNRSASSINHSEVEKKRAHQSSSAS